MHLWRSLLAYAHMWASMVIELYESNIWNESQPLARMTAIIHSNIFLIIIRLSAAKIQIIIRKRSNQSLDVEQSLFAFQSCRISRKTAIAAYYTVAGDYDGKRIAMTGLGNCSCSFWIAYDGSKGRIRDGWTIGYQSELTPHWHLEVSAAQS